VPGITPAWICPCCCACKAEAQARIVHANVRIAFFIRSLLLLHKSAFRPSPAKKTSALAVLEANPTERTSRWQLSKLTVSKTTKHRLDVLVLPRFPPPCASCAGLTVTVSSDSGAMRNSNLPYALSCDCRAGGIHHSRTAVQPNAIRMLNCGGVFPSGTLGVLSRIKNN
jgi:hypothetical protein